MNSTTDALNTLISAVTVAHNKGGVYSLEESYHIYSAMLYLSNASKAENLKSQKAYQKAETVENTDKK